MNELTATIHNLETGQVEIRPLSDAEIKQLEIDKKAIIEMEKAKAKAEKDKAILLEKLGITEDEAKLLLS